MNICAIKTSLQFDVVRYNRIERMRNVYYQKKKKKYIRGTYHNDHPHLDGGGGCGFLSTTFFSLF